MNKNKYKYIRIGGGLGVLVSIFMFLAIMGQGLGGDRPWFDYGGGADESTRDLLFLLISSLVVIFKPKWFFMQLIAILIIGVNIFLYASSEAKYKKERIEKETTRQELLKKTIMQEALEKNNPNLCNKINNLTTGSEGEYSIANCWDKVTKSPKD